MNPYEIALIGGMAVITFAIRYTLFAVGHRVRFSPLVTQALSYVPVVVLTAIVAPAMLMPDGANLDLSLDNAYLVGGIVAIVIAAKWRNLLATIIGGLAFFFIWRWLFG
ncbi:AzlD domain-containing protein [Halopseudomonas laoshanensis]|uniref:AzlD domain-containing protein n=2 Tax=Halopseudomonas TaxID=2901189 RepID=A0A7V7KVX6_9GAMM|nr:MULTISPECIES: AzlD domain-containing protein [Halopseudomonas]KAA0695830.1 AzlD domain-containing protein [Halopseudomonas laoshanensis]PCC98477.1 branched-chain amino acid transport [Halopseudomonas pelagia]QFY56121.1 AzlD domain-containing protein [Halopseudomonas pelagia]